MICCWAHKGCLLGVDQMFAAWPGCKWQSICRESSMKVLVLGSEGQLGSELGRILEDHDLIPANRVVLDELVGGRAAGKDR
jgi:hypothetical protein